MKVAYILVLCLAVIPNGILGSTDSCGGRCNAGLDASKDCQCNAACENYGDCCTDYFAECLGGEYSCNSRCDESYNPTNPCHCNDKCKQFSNCCADYDNICLGGGSPGNTLSSLAQALWEADVNSVSGSDLVFNKQRYLTNYPARNDLSPQPLFTYVNQARISSGTWPKFRALLDNYELLTGNSDINSFREDQEVQSFLDEVFATRVMDLTYDYMNGKGYFTSVSAFRAYVEQIWFEPYSRSGGTLDTSGFEHVFVGEVKSGKVSGYHNWLAFYEDELEGKVNYYGYTNENEPNQILMQFRLDADNGSEYYKELSSIFYGVSPEFELAIFTACFRENPNAVSTFTINGHQQSVQTWDYNGPSYIGSAYFNV